MTQTPKYLRAKEISKLFSISVPTLYRYLKEKENFPKPIKPTQKTTLWNVQELEDYFKKCNQ